MIHIILSISIIYPIFAGRPAGRPAGQLRPPPASHTLTSGDQGVVNGSLRAAAHTPPAALEKTKKHDHIIQRKLFAHQREGCEGNAAVRRGHAELVFSYAEGEGWIFAHHSPSAPHLPCDHTPPPLPSAFPGFPPAHCSANHFGDDGATALAASFASLTALENLLVQYAILKFLIIL